MTPSAPFAITRINQVAMVVHDLEATVRAYWERLGIGPWQIYTYGAPLLKGATYHGRAENYSMRLAFTWCGELQLEVIQPLSGSSIYADFLRERGEGLHHVGIFVSDFEAAVADLQARGYAILQSGHGFGKQGDGAFAYFATDTLLATTLEIIAPPRERHPPEAVYPPGAL